MTTDEEELTTGSRERGPRTRLGRLRLDLLAGALILGGVIVVGRAMSHHNNAAKSTPTPTPSASAPVGGYGSGAPDSGSGLLNGESTFTVTTSVVLPTLPQSVSTDPTRCPPGTGCYTVLRVAAPVLAALHRAFPGAVVESAETIRLDVKNYGPALWYLQVNARSGAKEILLRLQTRRPAAVGQYTESNTAGVQTWSYSQPLLQYFTYVRVRERGGDDQDAGALYTLGSDVRLLDRG